MKKTLLTITLLIGLALPALAQTNTAPVFNPNAPPDFPTNQLQQVAGGSAVASFFLNLWPAWDRAATGSFPSAIEVEVSPAWKSSTAAGSTPYLSVGGGYWFSDSDKLGYGVAADVVTFGNGTGGSTLDSVHLDFELRKALGNVAGHFMLGPERDSKRDRYGGEVGAGFEFRYKTGVSFVVDTRYIIYGKAASNENEWLTRVGLSLRL